MNPWEYQNELSDLGLEILKEHGIVYYAMEERTGKSYTGLLVVEKSLAKCAVIVTKRKAFGSVKDEEGWANLLDKAPLAKEYILRTYGTVKPADFDKADIVILDEAHNYISGYPKPSSTWKKLRPYMQGKAIIYMSATPHAQGLQLMYHQLALSSWSPWKGYSNFYNWFRQYGRPYTIKAHGREVNQYDKVQDELIHSCIDHLFITKTRKELGFGQEPEDVVHYIDLSEDTKKLYNNFIEDKIMFVKEQMVMGDTVMKFRTSLHMLEGGTMKFTSARPILGADLVNKEKIKDVVLHHSYFVLDNDEKIQYILKHWGDNDNVVIMYNFIGEKIKLEKVFKKAKVRQATSYSEGVDFSDIEHMVIYSQDYSTARHTQRRARQANKERSIPIRVHFLLIKKAISEQVYKTVSVNKSNYVDSRFERSKL